MSSAVSECLPFFQSRLENQRFDDDSLQILESILSSRDLGSLMETRAALRQLLRSEVASLMGVIAKKSVDRKLGLVEFFVRAFALVGDVESCLALKYEALILRDTECINDHGLQVAYDEWLTFAKDSFDNGFYAIAVKGFDYALFRIQSDNGVNPESKTSALDKQMMSTITELRGVATALIASHSVQTEAAVYLKRKAIKEDGKNSSSPTKAKYAASSLFRKGINKRNMQKLYQSRGYSQHISGHNLKI